MEENPNLSYVREIAGEDNDFAKRFIALLKEEFTLEIGMYLRHIRKQRPRDAAEIVSKSKYKLSMLGLEKGYTLAASHEQNLHMDDTTLDGEFQNILRKVNTFLKKI